MNETKLQDRYFRKLDIRLVDGEYESTINNSLPRPQDVYKTFIPLRDKGREEMIAIYLTADLYVVAYDVISTGNKDTATLYMDELLEGVILTRAKFFVILHNHPSGHAIPSKQDLELMMRLKEYMEPLNRTMLDFLIVGHPK